MIHCATRMPEVCWAVTYRATRPNGSNPRGEKKWGDMIEYDTTIVSYYNIVALVGYRVVLFLYLEISVSQK